MEIIDNYDLTKLNTLGLKSQTRYYVALTSVDDLSTISAFIKQHNLSFIVLGQGSNLILPEYYNGIVIHNLLHGISKIQENDSNIFVKSMAGELWDDLVMHTVSNNWYGLENLSLIPGTVGASPMQNIGAYGVEVKNFIKDVTIYDIKNNIFKNIPNQDCNFAYRNSIFKTKPDWIIIDVTFELYAQPKLNINYTDLQSLKDNPHLTAQDVRQHVINVRSNKLPDPKILGNVGSFFHNPIIAKNKADELKMNYPNLPVYPIANNDSSVKISAGWLIDNLKLKGYRQNNVGIYEKQALVLVNFGNSTQDEILNLAHNIQEKVYNYYGVTLNIEPIVIKGDNK